MSVVSSVKFNPLVQSTCAVFNLVACCGIGIGAFKSRVLDQAAISALARLVYNVFQPSLLFTNVLQTLATPSQSSATLFLLPLAAFLHIMIASVISSLMLRILRISSTTDEGRETRICSTFANAGPLPLLFVDALFKAHPDPTIRTRAVAFISFYLLAWSPLFWNYGYSILTEPSVILGGRPAPVMLSGRAHKDNNSLLSKKDFFESNTKAVAPAAAPPSSAISSHNDPFSVRRMRALLSSGALKKLLNPPTLGCLLGAVVGVIPPFRRLFLGEGAPFSSIFDSLRTMGSAYVPCVLLILSGSLASGWDSFDQNILKRAGVVMFQRFLIMPTVAITLVHIGTKVGIIPTTDPLLVFILLLQACMPCAQNSVLILQLEKRPQAAASMARLISTVYVLSVIPIALLLQGLLSICPVV